MRPKSERISNTEDTQSGMIQLGPEGSQPQFCCTRLPRHWRSNKSLAAQFRVIAYDQIPDNTRCSLLAGNDENHSAQLKNNVTYFHNNVAEFSDLRFVGKSGRGKLFNVTVTMWTDPVQVLVYRHAIKVTADGPRPPRPKSGFSHGNDPASSTTSDSSTDADSHDHAHLNGIEKKPHRVKPKQATHLEMGQLGLGDTKNILDLNRPSSCHSNSSTLTTTTTSMHSIASLTGTSPTSGLEYLAAVVAANVAANLICQSSQPSLVSHPNTRPASYGHKPWLKLNHDKQIWRPYIDDSH